ncbi:MAG TPA: hypothetical protein VFG79_18405 [Solirubrobacter sp.]|jgi:hypothetical protein|nr:hypothetical protein [Solirubrobacter sp.]
MTLLLVLLVLLPWSIWRQMHAHQITGSGLIRLPIIFAAIGVLGFGTGTIPTDGAALAYVALCLALSVGFGLWRGARVDVWRDAGRWMSRGNRTTLSLWAALIGAKVVLGTIASITGWFPAEHAGDVFIYLTVSFVAQNLVVAQRSLWAAGRAAQVTA